MSRSSVIVTAILFLILVGLTWFLLFRGERFELPRGETTRFMDSTHEVNEERDAEEDGEKSQKSPDEDTTIMSATPKENSAIVSRRTSTREVFVTDGVKHSIPLNEILSGGPPKDGIPAINDPKFITPRSADAFLDENDIGLGLVWKGEARFYPYDILVWHELVNDSVQGDPLLVTYCPLCMTGIVFERKVNGKEIEFGVSGLLWQSNLLMYNRTGDPETESLWSQVLGEAVLGPETGDKLGIVRSDTVKYGDWKRSHPNTKVLSRETGVARPYGSDPYGDYFESAQVSFGATFTDTRLHPKAFVLGIEVDGKFKAYEEEALRVGTTVDQFAGETITIEKSSIGEIDFFIGVGKQPLETIDGFWFSWVAVHPLTELYTN